VVVVDAGGDDMGFGPQRGQDILCGFSIVKCNGSCRVQFQHLGMECELCGHRGTEAGSLVEFQCQARDAQAQNTGEKDYQCQLSLNRAGSNERHFKSLGDRRLASS
jgi:hypothetical protein